MNLSLDDVKQLALELWMAQREVSTLLQENAALNRRVEALAAKLDEQARKD